MESQVTTIVCPNCGANTSNLHNCEYCGSMLVRFSEKNIVCDESKYGKSAKSIPGLEMALKNNLSLQKTESDTEIAVTQIISSSGGMLQILPSKDAFFGFVPYASSFSPYGERGLILRLPFAIRSVDMGVAETEKIKLERFKEMDCYELFTPVESVNATNYMIDFGEDYESASRMITSILSEIDGPNDYECKTFYLPKKTIRTDDDGTLTDSKDMKKVYGWIAAGIIFLGFVIKLIVDLS